MTASYRSVAVAQPVYLTRARGLPGYVSTAVAQPAYVSRVAQRILDSGPAVPFSLASLTDSKLLLIDSAGMFQESTFATPASADGDRVGGWRDQSGQVEDFIQATAGQRGTLKTAANGISSRSVVRGDGSDDILTRQAFRTSDTAGTLIIVAKPANVTAVQAWWSWGATGSNAWAWALRVNSSSDGTPTNGNAYLTLRTFDAAGVNNSVRGDTILAAATPYIFVITGDGATYTMRVNGVAQTIVANTGSNNGKWIGAVTKPGTAFASLLGQWFNGAIANPLNGDEATIVYCSSALSLGEIQNAEFYLATRFGISI